MNQSQAFGVLIPGGVVRTDFIPVDGSGGTKFQLSLTGISGVEIPRVSDLVFFLLPGISLPDYHGAMLYWQVANTPVLGETSAITDFELVGAISNDRKSGVFRTGWATNESLTAAIKSTGAVTVNLGVSIEPLSSIQNVGVKDRTFDVAKKIATDLFNYMQSFDTGVSGAGYMTVPTKVFERWIARFESKAKIDPNFFMKSSDS